MRATKTIRVRPGESVRLRLIVEGEYRVEGDVAELAKELYENAHRRLLKSKSPKRRKAFV